MSKVGDLFSRRYEGGSTSIGCRHGFFPPNDLGSGVMRAWVGPDRRHYRTHLQIAHASHSAMLSGLAGLADLHQVADCSQCGRLGWFHVCLYRFTAFDLDGALRLY
jgi:hypothetical protein